MISSHVSLIQYLQSCCYCCMPFASHDPLILCLLHHVILHIIRSIEHVTCHIVILLLQRCGLQWWRTKPHLLRSYDISNIPGTAGRFVSRDKEEQ